jgi:hypothetical protein
VSGEAEPATLTECPHCGQIARLLASAAGAVTCRRCGGFLDSTGPGLENADSPTCTQAAPSSSPVSVATQSVVVRKRQAWLRQPTTVAAVLLVSGYWLWLLWGSRPLRQPEALPRAETQTAAPEPGALGVNLSGLTDDPSKMAIEQQDNTSGLPPTGSSVPAERPGWHRVVVAGRLSFDIPTTMELQAGPYRTLSDEYQRTSLGFDADPDRLIVQPTGVNASEPTALARYSRLIVETVSGRQGDYPDLGVRLPYSTTDLDQLDTVRRGRVEKDVASLAAKGIGAVVTDWVPVRIVRLGDNDALTFGYTRSMDGAPAVQVRVYQVSNNDQLHTITASYRVSEADLWADDLGRIVETIRFVRR